jgi:hypothetical protein
LKGSGVWEQVHHLPENVRSAQRRRSDINGIGD